MLDTFSLDQQASRTASEAALRQNNPELARHLFNSGPKRILALDGGGVLGVIEVAFLERVEALLRRRTGNPNLVLSDYFDLIGGTSTGAIIATALSLGMTARQVKKMYFDFGREIFRQPLFSIPGIHPRFDARALSNKLRGVLGNRQVQSTDVMTGLAIVTKRVDTGSAWVIFNHPCSKFWEDWQEGTGADTRKIIGNKRYLLRDIVRASTAAPYYFNPKRIKVLDRQGAREYGLFVDGALSTYNNPSLLLFMLASMKGYGIHWPTGAENLLMISIGSGAKRPRMDAAAAGGLLSAFLGVHTLRSMIWDSQIATLKMMQWLSKPARPWKINGEVGDLSEDFLGSHSDASGCHLAFQRYDVALETDWIAAETGKQYSQPEIAALDDFMNPKIMLKAYEIACKVAECSVDESHFPAAFEANL